MIKKLMAFISKLAKVFTPICSLFQPLKLTFKSHLLSCSLWALVVRQVVCANLCFLSCLIHHHLTGHINPSCRGSQVTMAPGCDTAGCV